MTENLPSVLSEMLETTVGDSNLFRSYWLSDGLTYGDLHTGANICSRTALRSFADVLEEVLGESGRAERFRETAAAVRDDIEAECVIENPTIGRPQYTEGTNTDGSRPNLLHDGEETDTTLMPFYGYCSFDDPVYKECMDAALSEDNRYYNDVSEAIKWGGVLDLEDLARSNNVKRHLNVGGGSSVVPATCPSYITGFASIEDEDEMETQIAKLRRRTDMDGLLWWWPYDQEPSGPSDVVRENVAGKSGWAAGTFAALFISEILGLEYDDADRTLRFEPLGYTGDFRWTDARFGRCSLDIEYVDGEDGTVLSVANRNSFPLTVQGGLPVDQILDVTEVNGDETRDFEHESHFDRSMIRVSATLEPGERLVLADS